LLRHEKPSDILLSVINGIPKGCLSRDSLQVRICAQLEKLLDNIEIPTLGSIVKHGASSLVLRVDVYAFAEIELENWHGIHSIR
jgi:hypothetical protein